jgi:hypothetical protein
MVPILRKQGGRNGASNSVPTFTRRPLLARHKCTENHRLDADYAVGDVMSKYYIVDGVDALQKFGQDAW